MIRSRGTRGDVMHTGGLRIFRPDDAPGMRPAGDASVLEPTLIATVRQGMAGGIDACRRALRETERSMRRFRKQRFRSRAVGPPLPAASTARLTRAAERTLAPRVAIIAETSIPQCTKYRVVQKQEAFHRLGVACEWASWTDAEACRRLLQTASLAILYRVPGNDQVLGLIDEARRLRITTLWEADDLIFEEAVLRDSRALARVDRGTFHSLLEGAALYRRALLACDGAIASTAGLAEAMTRVGAAGVHVVENGLDEQTLATAAAIAGRRPAGADAGRVKIVYGSGTNTHDLDFEEAAPALDRILGRHAHVRLRLIGHVAVPAALARHEMRIERIPATGYEDYLALLAEGDVSIAPLEDFVFNDAKSNIKYLEASALGLPSACSPRAAFATTITHGSDGFLCGDAAAWEEALESLVTDALLRARVGAAARETVLLRYAPTRIARGQVAPLVRDRRDPRRLRLLSVNVVSAPRSFGGATIVAESVNRILQERHGVDVHAFTTLPEAAARPYSLVRYEADGVGVFGMGLPAEVHEDAAFDSPHAARCFGTALDAVRPDVVHFHCGQGIDVGAMERCREAGIAYVVTLHEARWPCSRRGIEERTRRSLAALARAALLLKPSRSFAEQAAELAAMLRECAAGRSRLAA